MYININSAISALDAPSSLLQFFIKDSFDVGGRTIMAQREGGKHEAREKFIEEAGTSLFWIGGIPAVRALINKLYKGKIDSDIHFKRIDSDGIQNYFAQDLLVNVKGSHKPKFSTRDLKGIELGGKHLDEVKAKLKNAGYKPNKTKGMYKLFHLHTTTASVLINLVMLSFVVPQANQLLSRILILKEVKNKKNIQTDKTKTVSFKGLGELVKFKDMFNFTKMAQEAQLNPVNGMLLLDYGISGSRVTITPRNNNERIENAVKEGGIVFFFYYAADVIKKQICKFSDKFLNVPIDLDYKILSSKIFFDKLVSKHDKESLFNFPLIKDDEDAELKVIKLIDKELAQSCQTTKKEVLFKNLTLQMAMLEGLIDCEYDSKLQRWTRHSKKYIQTDKVIALNNNLRIFYEKFFKISPTDKEVKKAILTAKGYKMVAVFANIAICCASLSFIMPKIQYMVREYRTKTSRAPGVKMYEEMAENNQL